MRHRRFAFSLIEMMVALAILAAVATIALRSASGLQNQARYQATTRSLDEIRSAIIGSPNQRGPDGSTTITGFVADMGRLPQFLIATGTYGDPLGTALGDPLTELLQQNSLPAFTFVPANSDPLVLIGVGWKGPYLRLGAGPTFIRDGFGNSFHTYDSNGNLLNTAGGTISQISSWGSDKIPDTAHGGSGETTGYRADVSVPYPNTISASGGFTVTGSLYGLVSMNSATDTVGLNTGNTSGTAPNLTFTGPTGTPATAPVKIWVVYFGPDLTQSPNPVAEVPVALAAAPFTYMLSTTSSHGSVTTGSRVLKAYVLPASVSTFNLAAANSAYVVSPPLNINVSGGPQTVPNLVLPHYAP